MPITKPDVLEVLRDPRLHNIRFSVGPINVNADEYDNVADYIESEAIQVVPGDKTYSIYVPENNTLRTRSGNPPLNNNARSNMLHECTHAISDINQAKVTRLADEAAAYLAQMAYLLLLDPGLDEPPIGPPINNMMRQCMHLVKQYQLGKPAGYNKTIDPGDVSDLAKAVLAIPDYHDINPEQKLAADGVSLTGSQSETFYRLRLQRYLNQAMDDLIAKDVSQMLMPKVRYVTYENWVTSDSELLGLIDAQKRGADVQKQTARQKLLHIFLTVSPGNAVQLFQRLSGSRKGDIVSAHFQSGFSPSARAALLNALQLAR